MQFQGRQPPQPDLVLLDVTDIDKIMELAQRMGPVDILINNAGVNLGSEGVDGVQLDNMHRTVFVNYLAPMAFVSAFAPMMKQRGNGHIINICSTAGHDVYANSSVYCSTKAALTAYTIAARHDLVDTPIRVTSISPGLVDTPIHEKKVGDVQKARSLFDNIVPLYPEDIADQIIYACTRPRHVQIADIKSYATNQSHSSMNGIAPVARVGSSLGAKGMGYTPSYAGQRPPSNGFQNLQVRDAYSNNTPGTPPYNPPYGDSHHGRSRDPSPIGRDPRNNYQPSVSGFNGINSNYGNGGLSNGNYESVSGNVGNVSVSPNYPVAHGDYPGMNMNPNYPGNYRNGH